MHAESSMRQWRILTVLISILAITGCGEGDGQATIPGTAATPVPTLPPGFCDATNFEVLCTPPNIINFNGGATDAVDNPDKSGINTSDRVAQMRKFPDEVFGGTLLELADAPIDFADGESYTVKVWSPRSVAVSFKIEQQGNPAGGVTLVSNHSGSGTWEELCFDYTGQTASVPPPVIALTIIFDNGTQGAADTDPDNWTFYYDDITQVASCSGSGGGAGGIVPDSVLYATDPNETVDLVVGVDYTEVTPFGSGSVIDAFFADDNTYSPVLAVFSGTGYGANVGQVGYTGFTAGFASGFGSLDFKVKGMPNFVIFVKLFDSIDTLRINLTSSTFSEALANDWFQVSIPLSSFNGVAQATGIVFESDDSAPMQFSFSLTDIGFSATNTGGGGGGSTGTIPDDVIYASDTNETVDLVFGVDYAEFSPFGSGSTFNNDVTTDADFSPAFGVTTGDGYGAQVGQFALVGFTSGFASGYATLDFKAKGLNEDVIRLKLVEAADSDYVDVTLTSSQFATALGNGWYQVSLPITSFGNAATADGLLFETGGTAPANAYTFLLTDFGFSGTASGGGGGAGEIAVNGGFESGDFSNWQALPGGGIQAVTTDNPSSGTFAANLTVPVRGAGDPGIDNLIKNANLQAGNLTPGASVTVSFDMRGSLSGAGGVVFAELFSELSGGGTSKAEILSGGPLAPVTTWTNYSYTTTLGSDVSGGLSLQLKASCGPVEGCGVDVFFDNVSIVTAGGGTGGGGTGGGGSGGGGSGGGGTGGIAINGDFETGVFNDGSTEASWQQFLGGGIQTIITDNPSSGTFAANLNVPVRAAGDPAVDNLIKNANLEAGNLTPGASVTVSFDMRGSLSGAGGVVFAEFFSELTGGGTSKAEIFSGGPLTPTMAWTNYSYTTTLGSDVSGGVTLQLKTSCGPVEGCGVDAYFDNVSIVIN